MVYTSHVWYFVWWIGMWCTMDLLFVEALIDPDCQTNLGYSWGMIVFWWLVPSYGYYNRDIGIDNQSCDNILWSFADYRCFYERFSLSLSLFTCVCIYNLDMYSHQPFCWWCLIRFLKLPKWRCSQQFEGVKAVSMGISCRCIGGQEPYCALGCPWRLGITFL